MAGPGNRVLVVDDVRENVDTIVETLKDAYRLSVALSGESALRVAERSAPDLVLLDVMMPGMDGYEVCRRLRGQSAFQDTPIVFLSNSSETLRKVEGFDAGGTDYLTKPIEPLELRARVQALLRAKAYNDHQREQLAAELRIARDIQMGMLSLPGTAAYGRRAEVRARVQPAREVGGDFYHAEVFDGRWLGFAVGDVSGKSISAAMFMMATMTHLKAKLRALRDPLAVLDRLNTDLCADNPSTMFVTVLCGVLDLETGRTTLASAGHPSPYLLLDGHRAVPVLDALGTALGLDPQLRAVERRLTLTRGEGLFAYTDGVTDATDREGRWFGEDRMVQALTGASTAAGAVDAIDAALAKFREGAPQADDVAVLAVHYLG